eukprot:Skav230864  [mRNA]  locus=scaffold1335:175005:177329:- [translate_table: standard]
MVTWFDTALAPCWWIADLYEQFKTYVDTYLRKEAEKRKQKFQYKLNVDMLHFGGSLTHALSREPKPPRPQWLEVEKAFHGTLVRQMTKSTPKVHIPEDGGLQLANEFTCNNESIRLQPTQERHCVGSTKPLECHVNLKQLQLTVDADEAADAFFQYWNQCGSEGLLAQHLLQVASTDPNRAFGPASALRCYISQIQWSVDAQGNIIDHMDRVVRLTALPQQHLFARIRDAWCMVVQKDLQKRAAFKEWPEVDIATTLKVLLQDEPGHESIVCIARAMGYFFHEQCQNCDNDGDDGDEPNKFATCPLCGADNT